MVYYHADDYGINVEQSRRILACTRGALNSVSIMPNSPYIKECISLLPDNMKKSVHINLVEGRCCADSKEVSLLVNKRGYFDKSFVSIWLLSVFKRKELRKQLRSEISKQINTVASLLPEDYKLRIDGHMHCHMIPLVFEVLCQLCNESEKQVEYIRFSVEPVSPIKNDWAAIKRIHLINIIKTIILHIFGIRDKYMLRHYQMTDKCGIFFGLIYTGEMAGKHIERLIKKYQKLAQRMHKPLECLFHPGNINCGEYFLDENNKGCVQFYLSSNRQKERKMLLELQQDVS